MTDKAEDVVARLKSWATGSYDVELASARINVRDVRDALALIAAQAAEISALKAKLAHYTYKTDPYAPENKHQLDDMAEHIIAQAAEIAALKVPRRELINRLMNADIPDAQLKRELYAALRGEPSNEVPTLRPRADDSDSGLQSIPDSGSESVSHHVRPDESELFATA